MITKKDYQALVGLVGPRIAQILVEIRFGYSNEGLLAAAAFITADIEAARDAINKEIGNAS